MTERRRLDATDDAPDHPGMPGWVKGFAVAGVILVALIVVMLLTGHGPGRHMDGLGAPGTPMRSASIAGAPA